MPGCGQYHRGPVDEPARYRQKVSIERRRRPVSVVVVIVVACACLSLGWWQWTRFEQVNGTFQNLGYALQWPAFAWFCVYAYRKSVRYEHTPPEADRAATEIPAGMLPARPSAATTPTDDHALREYNAYLAELADNDRKNRNTA